MARGARDRVHIEGLDELTAAIPGLPAVIAKDTLDSLEQLGAEIGRVAQANSAVLTGAMRDSVEVIVAPDVVIVTAGGEKAPYSVVQHQTDTHSHWFLKDAADLEGSHWKIPHIKDPIRRARAERRFGRVARRIAS